MDRCKKKIILIRLISRIILKNIHFKVVDVIFYWELWKLIFIFQRLQFRWWHTCLWFRIRDMPTTKESNMISIDILKKMLVWHQGNLILRNVKWDCQGENLAHSDFLKSSINCFAIDSRKMNLWYYKYKYLLLTYIIVYIDTFFLSKEQMKNIISNLYYNHLSISSLSSNVFL